jgi:subtilisin family serine protease
MCEYKLRGEEMVTGAETGHLERPQAFSVSADKLRATIFIHCDEDANFDGLPGVRMFSNTGRVRTAEVDFPRLTPPQDEGLDLLSQKEFVQYLSASMQLKPLNDLAALETGLVDLRVNHPDLTGEDVVIGIIDSGIDSLHPAFDGRIHSIWNQLESNINSTKPYGKIFSGANMAGSLDETGHGTHIAGIAAGFDAQFGGVAPRAKIVVVKTDFQTAHIADAIRHIFTIAEELGKPAVINLSAGGQLDSHDGTDDLSKFIEQELIDKPGRIIVAAAGNDAAKQIHARVEVKPQSNIECIIKVSSRTANVGNFKKPNQFIVRGWHDSNVPCEIEISAPSNNTADTFLPALPAGFQLAQISPTRYFPYSNINAETFISRTLTPCRLNNSHEFFVDTRRTSSKFLEDGDWKLTIRNQSQTPVTVDAWLWVPKGAKEAEFLPDFNNPLMKIGSPGCANEAITVASYTTRADQQFSPEAHTVSLFSSPGPLRNGNLKPDVVAPGAIIISTRSSQTGTMLPNLISGGFTVGSGTSMAAAFITGVCALLLQNNPALKSSTVKAWLQNNSRIPGQPAGQTDNQWGYGILNLTNLQNLP